MYIQEEFPNLTKDEFNQLLNAANRQSSSEETEAERKTNDAWVQNLLQAN